MNTFKHSGNALKIPFVGSQESVAKCEELLPSYLSCSTQRGLITRDIGKDRINRRKNRNAVDTFLIAYSAF